VIVKIARSSTHVSFITSLLCAKGRGKDTNGGREIRVEMLRVLLMRRVVRRRQVVLHVGTRQRKLQRPVYSIHDSNQIEERYSQAVDRRSLSELHAEHRAFSGAFGNIKRKCTYSRNILH